MTRADAVLHTATVDKGVKTTSGQFLRLGSHIEGKLLTILEASISDQTQLDALKSLVRQAIWGDFEQVTLWMANQDDEKGNTFPF